MVRSSQGCKFLNIGKGFVVRKKCSQEGISHASEILHAVEAAYFEKKLQNWSGAAFGVNRIAKIQSGILKSPRRTLLQEQRIAEKKRPKVDHSG